MLNTQQIFKEIQTNLFLIERKNFFNELLTIMSQPTTSKRSMEEGYSPAPKRTKEDDELVPISVIKHFIVDKSNFILTHEQIRSLFKTIRIMVEDEEVDKNNNKVHHYHILGEAKFTKRAMRDLSIASLRSVDIKGGLESKNFFLTARVKNIESAKHFQNTVEYLRRKNRTIIEDPSVQFGPLQNPLWKILDEAEEPAKYSKEDMAEFRRRFPLINSWKTVSKFNLLLLLLIISIKGGSSEKTE